MRSLEQRLTVEWQEIGRRVIADVSSRISALHQHIADSAPPLREEPRAQEVSVALYLELPNKEVIVWYQ